LKSRSLSVYFSYSQPQSETVVGQGRSAAGVIGEDGSRQRMTQGNNGTNHILARLPETFGLRRTFTALRYPNYRLWFFGQLVSLFGTWMQSTAQGFLVFELTRSPAYLGLVGFAAGIPSWLFMVYGGVIADRIRRRTLLIITQTAMLILAFVLAGLTFAHVVQPWHILVLAFGLGVANAFDAPSRHAFVSEMVPREDLTNAIALNSTMFNASMALGPAAAGVIYAWFGPGWCFTVNGISFVAVIVGLVLMKFEPVARRTESGSALAEIREGFSYIANHKVIAMIVAIVGITTFFGAAFITLFPAWAVKILHGDATTNGLMQSARGVGALCSALLLASLGRFKFKGRLLAYGMFAFPCMILLFASIRTLALSLLVLFAAGGALILIFNLANSLVQTHVEDRVRGRVMGVYSLTFFGTMPIGALWIGAAAEGLGEPVAVTIGATAMLGFAVLMWFIAPRLRRLE
jgi:MFS family permease